MMYSVGNHPVYVFLAYSVAIFQLTVSQSFHIVGSDWKTIKQTREQGYLYLLLFFVLTWVLFPFVYAQFLEKDFAEVSAALVTVMIAFVHFIRNVFGLLQVYEYRKWASEAIQILASHGIDYKLSKGDEENLNWLRKKHQLTVQEESDWRADRIKINETVIDNNTLRSNNFDLMFCVRSNNFNISALVRKGLSWLHRHFERCTCDIKFWRRLSSVISLKPRDPIGVWIRWAVPFFAQGLGPWIEEVEIPPDESAEGATCDFRQRQTLHARGILNTACLLQFDPDEVKHEHNSQFMRGHPLQWSRVDNAKSDISVHELGHVSRRELLLNALSSGSGFPFNESLLPISRNQQTQDCNTRDIKESGFESYQSKIDHSVEFVPAEFGRSFHLLDFKQLEYLTIIISSGRLKSLKNLINDRKTGNFHGLCHTRKRFNVNERGDKQETDDEFELNANVPNNTANDTACNDESADQNVIEGKALTDNQNNINSNTVHEKREKVSVVKTNEKPFIGDESSAIQKKLADDKIPVMNLKNQLGISSFSSDLVKILDTSKGNRNENSPKTPVFLTPLPLPISEKGQGRIFASNHSVLEVSGLIDINTALQAGLFWKRIEKGIEEQYSYLRKFIQQRVVDGANERRDSKELRDTHSRLEQVRLAAEYGTCHESRITGEQTISFLGVAMEETRSALQMDIREKQPSEINWDPPIQFSNCEKISQESLEFSASKPLSDAIKYFKGSEESQDGLEKFLEKRTTQIRIIWELQNACLQQLKRCTSPSNEIAMMSCLLAFPSLYCNCGLSEVEVSAESKRGDTFISVAQLDCVVQIIPAAGPQNLFVSTRIKENGDVQAKLAKGYKSQNGLFNWGEWRDAFNGRLLGCREWRRENGLEFIKGCTTTQDIATGVKKYQLNDIVQYELWEGWLPHIPQICDFGEEEFLLNSEEKKTSLRKRDEIRRVAVRAQIVDLVEQLDSASEFKAITLKGQQIFGEGIVRSSLRSISDYFWNSVRGQTISKLGHFNNLEITMSIFCNEKSSLRDLHAALSVLHLHIELHGLEGGIQVEKIRKWLLQMVCYSNYDPKVVCAFPKILKDLKSRRGTFEHAENSEAKAIKFLRASYMIHGEIGTLREVLNCCGGLGYLHIGQTKTELNFTRGLVMWTSWFMTANETLQGKDEKLFDHFDPDRDLLKQMIPSCVIEMLTLCDIEYLTLGKIIKDIYMYQVKQPKRRLHDLHKWLGEDPVKGLEWRWLQCLKDEGIERQKRPRWSEVEKLETLKRQQQRLKNEELGAQYGFQKRRSFIF